LKLLRDMPPGALFGLAAKNTLFRGLESCRSGSVTGAEWSDDQRVLTLTLRSGPRVTFTAEGASLLMECRCRDQEPGRQCVHVVTCWALLKKIVSPESLTAVRFSDRLLRDVEILLGLKEAEESPGRAEPPGRNFLQERFERARALRKTALATISAEQRTETGRIRMVLEMRAGYLSGTIHAGDEQLQRYDWERMPLDLRHFMAKHYYFVPSSNYFKDFSALGGGYPIVLRQSDGRELPLAFHNDTPLQAGVTFGLEGDSVRISKCQADGSPLPAEAFFAGECLFDLAEKAIRPISDPTPWQLWDSVCEGLEELYEFSEVQGYELDGATLTTSVQFFNFLGFRVSSDLVKKAGDRIRFIFNGETADLALRHDPSYLLEIDDDLDREAIRLMPQGELAGIFFSLFSPVFQLFIPGCRESLPQPLRAKKRVSAMIETGFALLEADNKTARDRILRAGLGGPDFTKRSVKSEARRMVTEFVRRCEEEMLLVFATAEGWRFGNEDRSAQVRLVSLLYRLYGINSFVDGEWPCTVELDRQTLLPGLEKLAADLRGEGFGLFLGREPLALGLWDFTVTAAAEGIDWFELRPEIRCNGELLVVEEIRRLLKEGVLRQGNNCYLLGDEQRGILELLTIGEGGKGKRKKKTEIVRIPRLRILDWLELRSRGVTLRLPPEEEKLLAGLTRLEKIPELPLPERLAAQLRPYQQEGFEWLAFLHQHRFGACLADDMGLGKTVQAITFLAGLAEGIIPSNEAAALPHLIVVPPSLLFNWESEIERFYPTFRVITYSGPRRSADFADADIVLTSYGILQRDAEILAAIPFQVVVFDEAQQVKNINAATTGAARRISAQFKLALTGTPMENHLGEYFSIMDLCVPGLLGSYEEFRQRIDIRGFGGIDTLVRRTRPFILRRSKQMIADELPPRVEADLYLEMNPKQRALYQRTVEEVKKAVNEAFLEKNPGQARMIALTAILRLRQICLCPSLVSPGARADSPKLECLTEQLAELRDEGHSVLAFSQFTSYLDIIEEGLKRHKLPYLRLDGSTPVPQRKDLVTRFQKSDQPLVFLISLKAGGKGLNLTRATYVYHLDPWWNPAVENQASDRAHRIGQTAKVTVTRLLMRHTVEEKMMALKERKLKLYKALLEDAAGAGGAALSKEDFDFLLAP
jgi:non-specific serine/threonine protein kinase